MGIFSNDEEPMWSDVFALQDKIKRLQEENERLNQELDIKEKMLDKFMIGSGETLKKLQQENEELKARFNELYNNAEQLANKYNKYGGNKENELVEIINKTTDKKNKYKQALKEIRDILCNGRTFYEGYFDTQILSRTDKAIKVINEVLNDRD